VNLPHNDDLIISNAVQMLLPGGVLPVYPPPPHCNRRGLTELGEHAIREIVKRKMIFDPDHMSVKGRDQALTLLESLRYSGVLSSHSWSTPAALPRIYRLGGVVAPSAKGTEEFVHKWEHLRAAFEGRQYFGVGFGADQNGFATQGGPRGADARNPVSYPYRSFDGKQRILQHRSGNREWDINVDGVAHYGMYPDWIEDLRRISGNRVVRDLARGSEAYLQMWERAVGVPRVRCPQWRGHFTPGGLARKLRLGDSARRSLFRAGQPVSRKRAWKWCTRNSKQGKRALGGRRNVVGVFDGKGRMRLAASTLRINKARGIGRGDRKRALRKRARSIGKGLFIRRSRGGTTFVWGTKGRKVSFAGVADRRISGKAKLRRYVKRSGLG
jgi:hypothetical protein